MEPMDFSTIGIAVIPVFYQSKKPSVRWQKYQHELPSPPAILRWFRPGRRTNAAVVCGWRGLTVLDFDTLQGYVQWQAWAIGWNQVAREIATSTYRVKTSRGMHVYVFIEETPRCGHFQWGDIKGRGGYVLIPPSVHPSGTAYTAIDEHAPILSCARLDEIIPDAPPPPVVRPASLQHVYAASSLWPATVIERIKELVPILGYFPDARPTGGGGRWYVARCPFHDDREPSMWIDTQRGICSCYAGCTQKPLDVIDLHTRLHGLDTKAAIRELVGCCRS